MGPVEMFFSAQSLLCAITVVGFMKLITAVLAVAGGKRHGVPNYKGNKILTVIVLPAVTVLLGAVYGVLVPFRPEPLMLFALEDHGLWIYLAFAAWGGACGQFAQTIYDRASEVLALRRSKGRRDSSPDPTDR